MEAEQYREWEELERQAINRVRKGNTPERSGVRPLFKILVLPSFDAAVHWEICLDVKSADGYFAIRTIWDRDTDFTRVETPDSRIPVARRYQPRQFEPTIRVQQVSLDTNWTETKLTELKSLSIPVLVDLDMIGCDGTFYEFSFDALFVKAHYGWWEEPPAGWEPLNRWLRATLEALEAMTVAEDSGGV
jgi:hypothetical protein